MERLLGTMLSIESRDIRYLERFELWNTLVRDGNIPSWKAVYSGRIDTYEYSLVSTLLFAPLTTEQRCLGSAAKVWICPHQIVHYGEGTKSTGTTEVHGCGGNGRLFLNGRCENALLSRWLMRTPQGLAPSHGEVKEALCPLDAPMCPHLRLNNSFLASIYHPDCQRLK